MKTGCAELSRRDRKTIHGRISKNVQNTHKIIHKQGEKETLRDFTTKKLLMGGPCVGTLTAVVN